LTELIVVIIEVPTMQFREHPALVCDGIRTWPPKWLHIYGPTLQSPVGEMGDLDSIFIPKSTSTVSMWSLTTVKIRTWLIHSLGQL